MKSVRVLSAVLGLGFTITSPAFSQNSNYSTNQYGSRSALMGGAVVGGVRDTSAGFYNPGALGFVDNASLSVSGNAYSVSSNSLENGVGTGEDIKSTNIQAVPTLLSGIYKFENAPEHTLGYSLITRTDVSNKFTGRTDSFQNVLNDSYSPGNEEFIGQYNLDSKVKEYWLGGSYSYKLSDQISIGASLFGALKNSSFTRFYFARAITEDGGLSTVSATNTFDYYNIRGLAKLGIAGDFKPLKLGLTFTTPSVDIINSGEVTTDITVTDLYQENEEGAGFNSFTGNDRQDNLDAKVKSPLSVAFGAEYEIESTGTTVGISAEYFDNVSAYNVITPEDRPFFRPSSTNFGLNNRDFLQLYTAADWVVNYGVGIEQKLDDQWKGYLSVRADKSSHENGVVREGYQDSLLNYDLYHAVVGASYRTDRAETSFGVQYSYGRNDQAAQAADFASANEGNFFQGEDKDSKLSYDALTLILGYTYFF
jgi:hypothetical protein